MKPSSAPLRFRFSPRSRLYTIRNPDTQLWSQHEIAQTTWPNLTMRPAPRSKLPAPVPAKQARVRGVNGDRTARNFLVVRLRDGQLIPPHPKYFVRPDPFTS